MHLFGNPPRPARALTANTLACAALVAIAVPIAQGASKPAPAKSERASAPTKSPSSSRAKSNRAPAPTKSPSSAKSKHAPAAGAAPKANRPYLVGTFNMAGGLGGRGDRVDTAEALTRSINDRGADIVFLQEACSRMTNQLAGMLGSGWTVRFLDTAGARCKGSGGSAYGIGIVARTSRLRFKGDYTARLPLDAFERRGMVCLDLAGSRPIFACSTHLTADPGVARDVSRRRQTEAITRNVLRWTSAGQAIIVGGDFNATPMSWALDPLWHKGYGGTASGSFVEVDSGPSQEIPGAYRRDIGQATFGAQKFDYIFVRDMSVGSAVVGNSNVSDHEPLWATVY